jgi:hypothetical protein
MSDSHVGLSHLEAYAEVMQKAVEITKYIHKHRGHMPVEDLMDSVMWKLEDLTGVLPDDA